MQYHAPLYRELAASDELDVHVFYLDRSGLEATYDPTMNARIQWDVDLLAGYSHEFVPNWSPSKTGPALFQRINPGLVRRLRRERFDAVLVQGYQSISSWLAIVAAKSVGTRVLFRGEATLRPSSAVREWIKGRILRRVFSWSDVVFYTCSGNREYMLHYGCPPEKLALLPCAVDNAFFQRDRDDQRLAAEALRREWGFAPHLPVLLCVARLDEYKNQVDLLRAVAELQRSGVEVGTVLVGDGPDRGKLEQEIERLGVRHVRFAGFVNQQAIRAYYTAADIFVLCSTYDPSPKAVNEALNFSLPLVCSDRPGTVGDVIVPGENALTYSPGDTSALAAQLRVLLQDAARREAMGRRSLALAAAWSLQADVRAVVDVLRKQILLREPHSF